MNHTHRLAFWLTIIGLLVILTVSSAYLFLITKSPLSFEEMDFNNSGYVTFSELNYANSYGTRELRENDKICTEFFALKDGLRIKLKCNATNL